MWHFWKYFGYKTGWPSFPAKNQVNSCQLAGSIDWNLFTDIFHRQKLDNFLKDRRCRTQEATLIPISEAKARKRRPRSRKDQSRKGQIKVTRRKGTVSIAAKKLKKMKTCECLAALPKALRWNSRPYLIRLYKSATKAWKMICQVINWHRYKNELLETLDSLICLAIKASIYVNMFSFFFSFLYMTTLVI